MSSLKYFPLLAALVFLFHRGLAAADSLKRSPQAADTTSSAASAPGDTSLLLVDIGAGLAIYNGNRASLYDSGEVGWSLNGGFAARIAERPLYFGVDLGLNFWSFTAPDGIDRNALGFQLLPTLLYRFSLAKLPKLTPSLGLSLGPNFYFFHVRQVARSSNQVSSVVYLDLYFEVLLRPGLSYKVTDQFFVNAEFKIGVLNFDFVFLPGISAMVAL